MSESQGIIKRSIQALASLKDAMRFPSQGGTTATSGIVWNVLSDAWNGYGYERQSH